MSPIDKTDDLKLLTGMERLRQTMASDYLHYDDEATCNEAVNEILGARREAAAMRARAMAAEIEVERLQDGIREFLESKQTTRKANGEIFPYYTDEKKLCALLSNLETPDVD